MSFELCGVAHAGGLEIRGLMRCTHGFTRNKLYPWVYVE